MNGCRIFRRTIDALIHVIHVDLVNNADMSHPLSHYRVYLRLYRLIVMAWEFEVCMGEELIARQIV